MNDDLAKTKRIERMARRISEEKMVPPTTRWRAFRHRFRRELAEAKTLPDKPSQGTLEDLAWLDDDDDYDDIQCARCRIGWVLFECYRYLGQVRANLRIFDARIVALAPALGENETLGELDNIELLGAVAAPHVAARFLRTAEPHSWPWIIRAAERFLAYEEREAALYEMLDVAKLDRCERLRLGRCTHNHDVVIAALYSVLDVRHKAFLKECKEREARKASKAD